MALVRLEDSHWKLPDDDIDLRGRTLLDAAGQPLGEIASMMVDPEREEVATVVLASGREVPVRDVEIRTDGVFYLPPAAETSAAETSAAPAATPAPGAMLDEPAPVTAPPPAGGIVEYSDLTPEFRRHYDEAYSQGGRSYDAYEPAYRFGYDMAYDGRFAGRDFEASEAELRQAYYQRHGYPMSDPHIWADVRDAVRHAYHRIRRG